MMKYSAASFIDVRVPMRDGITLAADVYLPSATGRFPVILSRSPYGAAHLRCGGGALEWVSRGFAFVGVDCRGRFQSEGECDPGVTEREDGYDTLDWLAAQPWCDGNVGMVGGSYPAVTQLAAAASGHPALKAIAPSAISSRLYDAYYTGGVPEMSFMPSWHIGCMCSRGREPKQPINWDELRRTVLPVVGIDEAAGLPCPSWRRIAATPNPADPLWQGLDLTTFAAGIRTPFFIHTSYFDLLGRGGIRIYMDLMNHPATPDSFKKHSWLRIGPWGHGVNMKEGEYTFGADSIVTEEAELDFLMSLLRGKSPATDARPGRIEYFTMGENQWHFTDCWPLPGTVDTLFYLGCRAAANTAAGDGFLVRDPLRDSAAPDHFTYDPANPVPSCGGRMVGRGGQKIQTEVEQRSDVLVYTTPELTDNLTVTGNVRMRLFISSSAPDTDFTAKLVDVLPSGVPMNVCDGIQRVRWSRGFDAPALLCPGEVRELEFEVDFTSYCFLRGHRVRLEISSSNFPHYDRNLNTEADFSNSAVMRVAEQTVHHSAAYPSCLILPVQPVG